MINPINFKPVKTRIKHETFYDVLLKVKNGLQSQTVNIFECLQHYKVTDGEL